MTPFQRRMAGDVGPMGVAFEGGSDNTGGSEGPSIRVRRGGNLLLIDSDSYFAAIDKLAEILQKADSSVRSMKDWEYQEEGAECPRYYLEVILWQFSSSKMDRFITEAV